MREVAIELPPGVATEAGAAHAGRTGHGVSPRGRRLAAGVCRPPRRPSLTPLALSHPAREVLDALTTRGASFPRRGGAGDRSARERGGGRALGAGRGRTRSRPTASTTSVPWSTRSVVGARGVDAPLAPVMLPDAGRCWTRPDPSSSVRRGRRATPPRRRVTTRWSPDLRRRCSTDGAWCSGICWPARHWRHGWRELLGGVTAHGGPRGGSAAAGLSRGFVGEQFARPEAVELLRVVRREGPLDSAALGTGGRPAQSHRDRPAGSASQRALRWARSSSCLRARVQLSQLTPRPRIESA